MYNEWTDNLKAMTERLVRVRQKLVDALRDRGKAYLWLFDSFRSLFRCINLMLPLKFHRHTW